MSPATSNTQDYVSVVETTKYKLSMAFASEETKHNQHINRAAVNSDPTRLFLDEHLVSWGAVFP